MEKNTSISRRKILATLGGLSFAGIFGYSGLIEPSTFTITKSLIKKENAGNKTRFIQLSDLHLNKINDFHKKLTRSVVALRPDFIVITGDSIDTNGNYELLESFLQLFPHELPKFAILGNWEHWAKFDINQLDSIYRKNNCDLLINRSVVITLQNKDILITGLDDYNASHPSLKNALRNQVPVNNHILLQHSPGFVDMVYDEADGFLTENGSDSEIYTIKDFKFDVMLSGHTHGGQIAPFGIAPITPNCSGRYLKGWYNGCTPKLFVSRGIGTSGIPLRFMSLPEIAFFEMEIV